MYTVIYISARKGVWLLQDGTIARSYADISLGLLQPPRTPQVRRLQGIDVLRIVFS
jgi:hypothetical protein